jgi:excisionase family DNA binding protein
MSVTSTGLGNRRRGILGPQWGDRDVFTLEEVSQILGLSRPATYTAVKKGEITTVKLGSRLIVPRCRLERLLEGTLEPRASGTLTRALARQVEAAAIAEQRKSVRQK